MEIKAKVNFDFGKLARELPKAIKKYTSAYAKGAEEGSKSNIDSGTGVDGEPLTPLRSSTLALRKAKGNNSVAPLFETGALYNSIKSKDNVLSMKGYGKQQNDGFQPPFGVFAVARPFISTTAKNKQKLDKQFSEDIRKALRK
jgi:hypothetical protein